MGRRQRNQVGGEVVACGRLFGGEDHRVERAGDVHDVNGRELGRHRRRQPVDQPPVAGDGTHVEGQHPVVGQMRSGDLEEFLRGHVRRDVGRAVGVHRDDVVFVGTAFQVQPPVADVDGEVGQVHAEVFPADFHNLVVEFEAVDGKVVAVDGGCLSRRRASRQADNRHAFHVLRFAVCVEKGTDGKLLPGSAVVERVGVIHRVDALPVVEFEERVATLLLHLNIVVRETRFRRPAPRYF